MEWEGAAIVLDVQPHGEGDGVATLLTEEHGRHRGLARGALGRSGAAVWQVGNVLRARWVARLADQLGSLSAELVHPAAALAMADPVRLAVLSSCCAIAAGALAERVAHPRVFAGLLRVVAGPGVDAAVRWEAALLAELGYGLDLSRCAVTGSTEGLIHVSPRSGRAVSAEGAGVWAGRLLKLPAFLLRGDSANEEETGWDALREGLALTGHFLARDAFGHLHRPLPPARHALYDRVALLARPIPETDHA